MSTLLHCPFCAYAVPVWHKGAYGAAISGRPKLEEHVAKKHPEAAAEQAPVKPLNGHHG